MERTKPASVPAYLSAFPPAVKKMLQQLRTLIRNSLPEAEESISYDIPCYKLKGKPVIYFAGFKNHVSVYPAPRGMEPFKTELAAYKGGKGTVQFPLNEPLPLELIARMVAFRLEKTLEKENAQPVRKKRAAAS
jgi:uncharacterized protein YdhG (YjbR/CyaY superfamily)